MNKKILKKIINKKSSASAILVSIVVFGAISIIAFGSAYMSIINMSKGSSLSDKMKAKQMLESGVEHFRHEFYLNSGLDCINPLFSFIVSSDLSYYVYCENDIFYSRGVYKNIIFIKEIRVPIIEEEVIPEE